MLEYSNLSSINGEGGALFEEGRTTNMSSVVGDILAEPQAVILYGKDDEEAVRDIMHEVVLEMAAASATSSTVGVRPSATIERAAATSASRVRRF